MDPGPQGTAVALPPDLCHLKGAKASLCRNKGQKHRESPGGGVGMHARLSAAFGKQAAN